jgi:hypothetical protein
MSKARLASVAMGALACIVGCRSSPSNVVVHSVSTADYTATLSSRNSGAMSRGSTFVSLRLKNVPDNDTHGQIVFAVTWNKPVEMKWAGTHELAISCTSCTTKDVDFEAVKSGDIVITYDENLRIN